jgi:Glycosyl hydrolase family 134
MKRILSFVAAAAMVMVGTVVGVLAATGAPASAVSACPSGMSCGYYTVSGLGSRKQAILNYGADTLDMAVAMLETSTMQANYAYGDGKTYDAANFGIFKQNWGMIRQCTPQYQSYGPNEWNAGAALNSNLSWDVQVLNLCQSYFGLTRWFGGHRNGATGLANPNTTDINNYKTAVYWIKAQIDSSSTYRTDNTRFWVSVPAI